MVTFLLDAENLYGELCAIVSPYCKIKIVTSWVTQAHYCSLVTSSDKKGETSHRILACP